MANQNPYGPVLTAALAASSPNGDVLEQVLPRSEGHRLLLCSPQSQGSIARGVGVSKAVVSYWRAGKQTPGLALRYKLQSTLGIPAGAWSIAPTGGGGDMLPSGLDSFRAKESLTTSAAPAESRPSIASGGMLPSGLDSARAKPPPSTAAVLPESRPSSPEAAPVPSPAPTAGRPRAGRKAAPEAPATPTTMEGVEKLLATIRAAQEHPGLLASEQVKLADSETKLLSLRHRLEKESELAEDRIVRQHPKWIRIRTRLAEVLIKYPEAARAVAAALRELDL